MKYRIADRTEPRFRLSKYRYIALNKELFEKFKEAQPTIKIDFKTFKELIIRTNEEFINFAVSSREGVSLPNGMGRISLGLFPPKKRPNNQEIIHTTGIEATHFNFDSGGFVGKILWTFDDILYRTDNVKFYGFIAHRNFKNKASNLFRTEPEKYTRIATMIKANEHYKRKNSERNKINSQSSDQSGEDSEQSS